MKTGKTLFYILLLCFAFSIVGCDFLKPKEEGKNETEKITFKIYRPNQEGEWLFAETHEKEIKKGEQPLQIALMTLFKEQPANKKLVNIFPENLQILRLKVDGNLAEINLNKEILKGNIGGSLHEIMLVTSIVNTATEFPEIKKVQILVEGKKIETIAGHMDILDPLQRDENIIKKQ